MFDQQFLERLALPIGDQHPTTQSVALVDGTDFQREVDGAAVSAAYTAQRRARVYEGINVRSDGWFSLAAFTSLMLVMPRLLPTPMRGSALSYRCAEVRRGRCGDREQNSQRIW